MKRFSMLLLATMSIFVGACNTPVAQAPGGAPTSAASDEDKQAFHRAVEHDIAARRQGPPQFASCSFDV